MKKLTSLFLFFATAVGFLQADVIDFESPTYSLGGLDGQNGWSSLQTGSFNGNIVSTTTDNEYSGGQAAGALGSNGFVAVDFELVEAGTSSYAFDFFSGSRVLVQVGGWVDVGSNDVYDNHVTETQFTVGTVGSGGSALFGIRADGFGTEFSSGVSVSTDTWYNVLVETSGFDVTMTVRDLSNGVDVDLNGGAAGTSFTQTLSASDFGAAINSYDGVSLRVDSDGLVDNITSIPEPSTLVLIGLVGISLFSAVRRRR